MIGRLEQNLTAKKVNNVSHFVWPVRVYYEDTDTGGIVYHANYLKFLERARTEWLRHLGFEQSTLKQELGIMFAVHSLEIAFRKPAVFDDLLDVETSLGGHKNVSLVFDQRIVRRSGDEQAETLCQATVTCACLDRHSLRPRAIPHRS